MNPRHCQQLESEPLVGDDGAGQRVEDGQWVSGVYRTVLYGRSFQRFAGLRKRPFSFPRLYAGTMLAEPDTIQNILSREFHTQS